jgi:hypothetical protein
VFSPPRPKTIKEIQLVYLFEVFLRLRVTICLAKVSIGRIGSPHLQKYLSTVEKL